MTSTACLALACSVLLILNVSGDENPWQDRFADEIYPLLTANHHSESCVECHDGAGTSDLVFLGHAQQDFRLLLQSGYLKASGPDTLLGRLTAENPKRRMPKKAPAWSPESIAKLQSFVEALGEDSDMRLQQADERFPLALLAPYEGTTPKTSDNQFVSFHQLKAKVQAIFGETWEREGQDLFAANVAMFGGADFKNRFNEKTQATSSFLTALDMMARDMISSAFTKRSGPFQAFPADSIEGIHQLYQSILFRTPNDAEIAQAQSLFDHLAADREAVATRSYDLAFQLTVSDPATGLSSMQSIRIPVSADRENVQQVMLDQRHPTAEDGPIALYTWPEVLALNSESSRHQVVLHNDGTSENVSFAGIRLRRVDQEQDFVYIPADSEAAQPIGAWTREDKQGLVSLEDEGRDKGQSRVVVSLDVPTAGDYHVSICWRKSTGKARQVLVEVIGGDSPSIALASPEPPPIPPTGQVTFHYDSSEDARAFAKPEVAFRFAHGDVVEISNAGTDERVTAGAIELVPQDSGGPILIDSREAAGNEAWETFKSSSFGAYNVKGTSVQDNNEAKGERLLRYRPCSKAIQGWTPDTTYHLRIYYPGKRGHETHVPVTVHASTSSPVIQLAYPPRAHAEGHCVLDASSTYTAQHGALIYHWQQLEGPALDYDSSQPRLELNLPRWTASELAWQALGRALLKHPDFLFTRPPSLLDLPEGLQKQRLQLVRLALDLVGRPPSPEEFDQLGSGTTLSELTDAYLQSKAFEDFYFHRIRLYLESQGTITHDEPARLWCYVAFQDLPFQQILTADYTVDATFHKVSRPDYHGRTGVLTTSGFIDGKPGLPHYNYAAQVSMLFLGYVYEVPPEIVEQREGVTAAGTTDPQSTCYSCHKILTPLAHQRNFWSDEGKFRLKSKDGFDIEASDLGMVEEYPFKGIGMEAFATQAVKKERFIRTIITTHFNFYFGRQMRFRQDERVLYKRVWDAVHADEFKIRSLIRSLVTAPEYLEGHCIDPLSFHHVDDHEHSLPD